MMATTTRQKWSWYAFDMGNSAHALLVSTVGFSLFFREYLLEDDPSGDFYWGLLTAVVMIISAFVSPIIASAASGHHRRGVALLSLTGICVISTGLLSSDLSSSVQIAALIYVLSATTYYIALPVYNSFLPEIADDSMQTVSAKGWAWGYVGGILSVAIVLGLGLLDQPVTDSPETFRIIFLVAALFNLVLSIPMLRFALKQDRSKQLGRAWNMGVVVSALRESPSLMRLLISYWLVTETATIVLYFTAIFLGRYAGLEAASILALTLAAQGGAFISTWLVGFLVERHGPAKWFNIVAAGWTIVPLLLWAVSRGVSYWYALAAIACVLGAHHAIVRGEVGRVAQSLTSTDAQGALWGYVEVAGRISQVLGPLIVGAAAYFLPLSEALLFASVFPLIALIVIRSYKW